LDVLFLNNSLKILRVLGNATQFMKEE